ASVRSVLNLNVPRYFIAYAVGERELGIFAAIASLVLAGLVVTSSLTLLLTPRLATYYVAGNANAFRQLMLRLVQISLAQGIAGVAIAVIAGPAILSLFFGTE